MQGQLRREGSQIKEVIKRMRSLPRLIIITMLTHTQAEHWQAMLTNSRTSDIKEVAFQITITHMLTKTASYINQKVLIIIMDLITKSIKTFIIQMNTYRRLQRALSRPKPYFRRSTIPQETETLYICFLYSTELSIIDPYNYLICM